MRLLPWLVVGLVLGFSATAAAGGETGPCIVGDILNNAPGNCMCGGGPLLPFASCGARWAQQALTCLVVGGPCPPPLL